MSGSPDFGNDPTDYTTAGGGSVQSLLDAATGVNSGWSFDTPKTPDTATTNAIQSMAPVQASASGANDYSRFWQGLIGSVVSTGTAVVAAKNGLVQPVSTTPVAAVPPNPNRVLLLVALGVGVVLLVTHKG
jgi:hypothetical protein